MSAAYEYRKIYADCVTPDGDVCVLYLNYVRMAGIWTARASVELYSPDGHRQLVHGTGSPELVDADTPVDALPLDVEVPGGRFRMTLEPELGEWRPPPSPVPALTWCVKAVRTRARVEWNDRTWDGTGYVDFVQLTRPTRLLGLRNLRWGRVHLPDRTVVIEHIDTTQLEHWDVGVDWRVGEARPRALHAPARLDDDGHGAVGLRTGTLTLQPLRVLHEGNAFDAERVPRRIDRWACEAIGGPTHEVRWYGTARLNGDAAPALWEAVRFG